MMMTLKPLLRSGVCHFHSHFIAYRSYMASLKVNEVGICDMKTIQSAEAVLRLDISRPDCEVTEVYICLIF